MNIAVMAAAAAGGYFGGLLARGTHLDTIRRRAIISNEPTRPGPAPGNSSFSPSNPAAFPAAPGGPYETRQNVHPGGIGSLRGKNGRH